MTPQLLRAWAKGLYTTEAGTEMLLRGFGGRFAQPGQPWIKFNAIPDLIGGLSGGERRFLIAAASVGGDVPVVLSDILPGLDRDATNLVLAAMAHAAGTHEQPDVTEGPAGELSFSHHESLHPWPKIAPAFQVIDGGKD